MAQDEPAGLTPVLCPWTHMVLVASMAYRPTMVHAPGLAIISNYHPPPHPHYPHPHPYCHEHHHHQPHHGHHHHHHHRHLVVVIVMAVGVVSSRWQ